MEGSSLASKGANVVISFVDSFGTSIQLKTNWS